MEEVAQQIVLALKDLKDPWWVICLQSVAQLAVLVTLPFLWRQLRIAEKTNKMQVSVNIIEYLQRDEVREARGTLIELGKKNVPFNDWSQDQKKDADLACSTYNLAGMLIKRNLVTKDIKEMILEGWENSISECFKAAEKEMLKRYRMDRGHDFWRDFKWLAEQALESKKININ